MYNIPTDKPYKRNYSVYKILVQLTINELIPPRWQVTQAYNMCMNI